MRSVSRNKTTTKTPTTFASLLSGQENSNFSHLRQQSIQESSALCPQDSPQAHLQRALPWGSRFHHRNSGATQTPKAHVDNGNMQKELCLNFPLECKLDHHLLWKASSRTGGPVGKLEKTSSRFTVNESCMFDQVRVMQYSFRGRHRVKDYFLWAFFGTWHLVKRTFYLFQIRGPMHRTFFQKIIPRINYNIVSLEQPHGENSELCLLCSLMNPAS